MLRHSIVLVLLAGISALASSVGADDEQSIKRPQARRIVSGPLPFQSHFQDRRSGNGPRDGRRPRPSLPAPPYAVQMEPLVQYSQRDPLYHQKNAINITASNDNKISLARADSQPESTNSISDTLNNLSEAQNRYDNPYPAHYYKEPEPIIEIIIKESNESLPAPPTPAPVHQLPPKKEPVQVFYIKYKKNPNSYGKNGEDDIIYEPPVPALTPPPGELEGETEHQSQLAHSSTPAPPPPPPPPSTTLRTIIHPDSEVFHGSGLHVTFGESETHYSDAEQEEQSAPEPSISLPTSQVPSAQNRESSGAQIKRQQQFPPYTPLQPGTYQTPPPPPSSQSSFQQPSQPSSFVKEQFPRQISQHQKPAFRPQHTSGLLSQPHPPQNHASPSQAPQFEQTFQQQPKFQQSAQQIQLRHNHQQQQQQQRQPNNQHFNSNLQTHSQGNTVRSQNVRPNQPPQQFQHTAQQTHQTQRPFYKPNDQPPRQHFHQPLAQATHQHTQPLHQSELASPSNNVQYSQFRSQPIHVQAQPNSFQQPQHHHHTQVEQKNQHTQFNQLQGQRQGITQAHFQQPQLSQQSNYASINQDHSKHQQSPSSQASFANIQPSSHVQQPTSVNFPAAIRQRPKSPLQIEFERQQQQRLQQLQQPQQQQNSQQELNPQQQQHQQQQQQQYKQHQHQLQQHQQQQHHQSLQQQQYQQQQQSISNLQQPKQNHNNLQQYQAQPQFNAQQQPQYHVNQQKQTQVRPSQSQQFQGNQPQSQQLSNYKPIQNQHQQAIVPQQSHFNSQPTPSSSGEIVKSIPKLEEHQVQPTPQPSPVYYESNQQSFSNNQRKVPQKSAHRHNQLEQQGIKYNKEPVYTTQSPFVSPTTVITPKPFKTYSHQPSSTTAQSIPQNEEIDEEQSEKILYERREKEKKKHEQNVAALPSEVPDDLREQLLQSGILGNADIQILDYDKVGDIPIESLPPEALENLYGAGSAPVPAVATPDDTAPKTPVEMKVVRYDPTTKEGQSLAETYVKEDATQLDPVVLNDSRYNRYLPLKVNGTNFPLPDAPQLDGRIINSVVVLAPVDYDFVHPPDPISDGDRDGRSTPIQVQGVRFIAGDILKDLVKEPTADNYVSWLEKEKSTPTDRQSVVLLVTSLSNSKENGKEKEIFMYDVNSTRISKLRGELSSAFVDVAESNAQSQDLDGLSSATNEEEVEETEAAASEFQSYKIASPVYQPENIKLAGFSNRDIDLAMSASEPELQQVDQDTTNFGDKISILSGYSRMKEY